VEPLRPAEASEPGERVFFGDDGANQPDPESPNKVPAAHRRVPLSYPPLEQSPYSANI